MRVLAVVTNSASLPPQYVDWPHEQIPLRGQTLLWWLLTGHDNAAGMARLCANADGIITVNDEAVLFADGMRLIAGLDGLSVEAPSPLPAVDAAMLADCNRYLADYRARIAVGESGRLYLLCANASCAGMTVCPATATGDVDHMFADHDTGILMNALQLYVRHAFGESCQANSLWLWGGGMVRRHTAFAALIWDDPFAAIVARAAGVRLLTDGKPNTVARLADGSIWRRRRWWR